MSRLVKSGVLGEGKAMNLQGKGMPGPGLKNPSFGECFHIPQNAVSGSVLLLNCCNFDQFRLQVI